MPTNPSLYNTSYVFSRTLTYHTAPVWSLQQKRDILISGSHDKTVSCDAMYHMISPTHSLGSSMGY